MHQPQQKRKRGVVLTPQGLHKLQAAISEAESDENEDKRYTLEALSFRTSLDPDTLMKVLKSDTAVDKSTLNRFFRAFNLILETSDYTLPATAPLAFSNNIDWGEAPDVSTFYGRLEELTTLKHWILEENCRLITLLGMGGIGKTSLSVKLVEQIQDKFPFAIWRTLRNTPPIKELLGDLIESFSNQKETDLPDSIFGRISRLIHYLRTHRCLIVLDNVETIIQKASGKEQQGYIELFRRLGEAHHQSCILLTSREKPKQTRLVEGETLPVRVLQIHGLQVAEAQEIFKIQGSFWGSNVEWIRLVKNYAGNPLFLNIASATIKKLFHGNISEFLKQNTTVFGEICQLLEQQFECLSNAEAAIIQGLALNLRPVSFAELQEHILPSKSPSTLLEALKSLEERCFLERINPLLLEKNVVLFSMPRLLREYVTAQIVDQKPAPTALKLVADNEPQKLMANSY